MAERANGKVNTPPEDIREEVEDEIPRKWPDCRRVYAPLCRAQLNAMDTMLGLNAHILESSRSASALHTHMDVHAEAARVSHGLTHINKTGMRKLQQLHMRQPTWGCYKVVENIVYDTIPKSKGSNAFKTIVNVEVTAYSMGIWQYPASKRLWKAYKASQCFEEQSLQEWRGFAALQIMAHQGEAPMEWYVVRLTMPWTLLGLLVV